jgi:hypothetical protein
MHSKPATTTLIGLAMIFGAAAATQVIAAPGDAAAKPDAGFEQADTDKDGRLSRVESAHIKGLAASFDQADANKDGLLSAEEYARVQSAQERARPAGDASAMPK